MNPWPDEPRSIESADPSFAIKHGGELTRKLVQHCIDRGYTEGGVPSFSIRCSYLEVGEHQHIRDDWHYDQTDKGWLYVDGVAPTEVEFALWRRRYPVPLRTLFPYHGMLHRSPRTHEAGWRYFFRLLHVAPGYNSNSLSLST